MKLLQTRPKASATARRISTLNLSVKSGTQLLLHHQNCHLEPSKLFLLNNAWSLPRRFLKRSWWPRWTMINGPRSYIWSCCKKINVGFRQCVYFISFWTILSVFIMNLGCKELNSILFAYEWNIMHYLYYVSSGLNGQWSMYLIPLSTISYQIIRLSYSIISYECCYVFVDLIKSIQDKHSPTNLINE